MKYKEFLELCQDLAIQHPECLEYDIMTNNDNCNYCEEQEPNYIIRNLSLELCVYSEDIDMIVIDKSNEFTETWKKVVFIN
jgi:recombinational DNA repair protein RecR